LRCRLCILTFFGLTWDYKVHLEKEINFLVFWGKIDRAQAIKMARWKRKLWVEMTSENLKLLYGTSSGSNSREASENDFDQNGNIK